MLIGTLTEPPTKEEAEAFFARWTAGLPDRLAWFRRELTASGGPVADGSTESLAPLMVFVVHRLGQDGPEPAPEWFSERFRRAGWGSYGAGLVEGLMAYVAEIYRTQTGRAEWVLDEDPKSLYFRQPAFRSGALPPTWLQVRNSIGAVRRGSPPDDLRRAVESVLAGAMRSETPGPATSEPEVDVTPSSHPDFTFEVTFPDDIEDRLGAERYAALEDDIAALPDVQVAMFEDRELCLVRTTAHASTLQHRVRGLLGGA
jgi:hypothetical protein